MVVEQAYVYVCKKVLANEIVGFGDLIFFWVSYLEWTSN
jgi:hypothetical protein